MQVLSIWVSIWVHVWMKCYEMLPNMESYEFWPMKWWVSEVRLQHCLQLSDMIPNMEWEMGSNMRWYDVRWALNINCVWNQSWWGSNMILPVTWFPPLGNTVPVFKANHKKTTLLLPSSTNFHLYHRPRTHNYTDKLK